MQLGEVLASLNICSSDLMCVMQPQPIVDLLLLSTWTELMILSDCYRGLPVGSRKRGEAQKMRFDLLIAGHFALLYSLFPN